MSESKTRKEYAFDVIDHIAYEIRMFLFCIIELRNNKTTCGIKNALIESFAIHFRNLYEFFFKTESRFSDNVYYADIFKKPFPLPEDVESNYKIACKKITHIDRNRTTLKEDGWNINKLYNVFKPAILSFINDHDIKPLIKEKSFHEINEFLNSIDNINGFSLPLVTDTDS